MTFDDYQACFNALFAADRQLNLVQARMAASGAAGATLDAFQLLRLAMVQCLERLEQHYARQYPDHELADVCALLTAQRAPEGQDAGALVLQDVLRRPASETQPPRKARPLAASPPPSRRWRTAPGTVRPEARASLRQALQALDPADEGVYVSGLWCYAAHGSQDDGSSHAVRVARWRSCDPIYHSQLFGNEAPTRAISDNACLSERERHLSMQWAKMQQQ